MSPFENPSSILVKKNNDQPLRDAMKDMFQEFKLAPKLHETQIKSLWERLMGPQINTYTSAIRIKDGVLTLTIVSASLKQELNYGKDKIRSLLNEELGDDLVKEVIIR